MYKKALVGFLAVMTVVTFNATPAKGQTIAELLALISQLQAQLAALQGQGGGSTSGYQFTRNLTLGSTGADVKELQKFLNAKGFTVSASGAGSPGNESTYFGVKTKDALAKFQAANGISPAVGYFGPITRAKINSMGGGGVVPVGTGLRVELVPMAGGTIPSGSIYNPLLKVKFTAGEATTITGLKVRRGGFIANTNVTGISVWDDAGNRYGNILTSLTSDGDATFTFGTAPITLAAGQSKVFTISANLATGAISGSISFSLLAASSVTVSGTTVVSGTFPINGPSFTVVDGSTSLGDIRMDDRGTLGITSSSAQNSATEGNLEVGYLDREIYKFNLLQNNSREAVKFERIRLYVGGTIQEDKDLKNFKLVAPDGTVLATADRAYDRYVTFNLTTPYVIDKGLSKDFTVRVDVTDGASRHFYVSMLDDFDLVVRGVTTGAGTLATDSTGATLTSSDVQNNQTGWFKIKVGIITISKASSSPSGNVAPGSQNVVLARYTVKAGGEALEVRKVGIQVGHNVTSTALTGTLMVRNAATGETYLSISADTSGVQTTLVPNSASVLAAQQNLSSYINIPAGQEVVLEVVGTVPQTATSSQAYTVYMGHFYAKRMSSNDYQTLAAGALQANTLTVQTVSMTVTKDTSFANTNRAPGATNVKIAQFVLRPSSADDVRVTTINVNIATSSNYQNLRLMDGSVQLGSTIGTPASTGNSFTLSNYVIAKDTPKTLSLYADVLSSATTNSTTSIPAAGVNGVGVNSSVSLANVPATDVNLQTIAMSAPTITIAADPSQPVSKIFLASQNGVEVHKIKFAPVNESLTLKKITLQITSANGTTWTTSSLSANLGTVMLYNSAGTLLGSGSVNSTDGTVIISGLNVTLPQDTDTVLSVKVNVNGQDTIVPISVMGLKVYSTTTADMDIQSSQGQLSTGITLTSNGASNYHLYTVAAPVITNAGAASRAGTISTADEIGRFTITNNGTRDITMTSSTFEMTLAAYGATSTIAGWKLYDAASPSTVIESDNTALTSAAAATTVSITFTGYSSTQIVPAGSSKTYILKASTTAVTFVNQSGQTVHPVLSIRVTGSTGYSAANAIGETEWADGSIVYSYTTTGSGAATYAGLVASDSGDVVGTVSTY